VTLVILERVPSALRGVLTRWLLEVHPGVFVGTISARVRAGLWRRILGSRRVGACTMIARASNEQGFTIETVGAGSRAVVDYDGLALLRRPK
jgi:CRISPR-associated protein Cas2